VKDTQLFTAFNGPACNRSGHCPPRQIILTRDPGILDGGHSLPRYC